MFSLGRDERHFHHGFINNNYKETITFNNNNNHFGSASTRSQTPSRHKQTGIQPPTWGDFKQARFPTAVITQTQLSRPMSSGHIIFMDPPPTELHTPDMCTLPEDDFLPGRCGVMFPFKMTDSSRCIGVSWGASPRDSGHVHIRLGFGHQRRVRSSRSYSSYCLCDHVRRGSWTAYAGNIHWTFMS